MARTSSTPLLLAPSISATSTELPAAISRQGWQTPQGSGVGPFSQLRRERAGAPRWSCRRRAGRRKGRRARRARSPPRSAACGPRAPGRSRRRSAGAATCGRGPGSRACRSSSRGERKKGDSRAPPHTNRGATVAPFRAWRGSRLLVAGPGYHNHSLRCIQSCFRGLRQVTSSGEGGIRTHGTPFGGAHDFQSCAFDHSATSPFLSGARPVLGLCPALLRCPRTPRPRRETRLRALLPCSLRLLARSCIHLGSLVLMQLRCGYTLFLCGERGIRTPGTVRYA